MKRIAARPQGLNLGDDLSNPLLYFQPASDYHVLGGGSYDLTMELEVDHQKVVAWGIGTSIKSYDFHISINKLPFAKWGLRDFDMVDSTHFVPCPSCMHTEIMSEPTDCEELYYLNARHKPRHPQAIYNDASYDEFILRWRKASIIVTNSYHGIYWGLLSGRTVVPFGYSSKFLSVMRMFGFELPKSNFYDQLNASYILETMSYSQYSAPGRLEEFREINVDFASRIN